MPSRIEGGRTRRKRGGGGSDGDGDDGRGGGGNSGGQGGSRDLVDGERECIFQGNEDYSRFTSFSVALCGVTPLGYTCWCAFDKD